MKNEQDKQLYETLTRTGRLLKNIEPVEGEEYTLESILAEFGKGAAEPAHDPIIDVSSVPAPEPVLTSDPMPETTSETAPIPEPEVEEPAALPRVAAPQKPAVKRHKILHFPSAAAKQAEDPSPSEEPVPQAAAAVPAVEQNATDPPDRVSLRDIMHDTHPHRNRQGLFPGNE